TCVRASIFQPITRQSKNLPKSDARILTTHAGSLPRPPELTRLFASRSRGETVDGEALAAAGRDAVAWVVTKQRESGIDVISNGEQQRESFVLYLRRRLSGIGGQGDRAPFADIESYPKFKEERARKRRPPSGQQCGFSAQMHGTHHLHRQGRTGCGVRRFEGGR